MTVRTFLAAALLCVLTIHAVQAKPRHLPSQQGRVGCSGPFMWPCRAGVIPAPVFGEEIYTKSLRRRHFHRVNRQEEITHLNTVRPMPGLYRVMAEGAGRVIGGRPAGCPRRYCGCGASLHIFGRIIPSLNLAANWLRFPRAMPGPGMVAARRGHVFVLERHIGGSTWLVYDANSGRHRTRIHSRSISGFKIVNPYGSRLPQ